MEASGQGGRSYEVRVTFRLPHVDGGDLLGYALEDQIVRLVGEAGGREATSQIQALGALQAP